MNTFATFNQFDKRFNEFSKFGSDRTACPLFGILSCYNFIQNGNILQKQHEQNIYSSVTNYMVNEIPKYMSFDELLLFTTKDLSKLEVGATTPELITTGVLSYEHIFKFGLDKDQRYCVLFLKNRNYLPILCDYTAPKAGDEASVETYSIRDCHENTQRTFNDFQSLRLYLDKTYQFEQMTIVDGVMIPEYSNIEYIVIDEPFELKNIDPDLYDHSIDIDMSYKQDDNIVPISTISASPYTISQFQTQAVPISSIEFDHQLAMSLQDEQGEDYVDFI